MDDPDIAWPAWKFGMKRDALFTTLHDEYNTFQSTIQDPDAFHHDVFEIASEAATTGEFHRLLSSRRDQRLRELNESLESASFEIIANPSLVGTTQWEYALQLFRTRSLDSLVRYFASYLPSSHPWHHHCSRENDEAVTVQDEFPVAVTAHAVKPFFNDAILTHEPMPMAHSLSHASLHHDLPPSPRSLTTYSDDMETSSHQLYCLNTLTPARTISFSDSEGDHNHVRDGDEADGFKNTIATASSLLHDDCPSQFNDDDTSQSSGPDTPASMSDAEPDVAEEESGHHHHHHHHPAVAAAYAATVEELAAVTPKVKTPPTPIRNPNEAIKAITTTSTSTIDNTTKPLSSVCRRPLQSGFVDADRSSSPLPVSVRVRHRSVSPSRPWPVVHADGGRHPATSESNGVYCRAAGRPSRQGCHYRLLPSQQGYDERSHRVSSNSSNLNIHNYSNVASSGRRRPRPGVEKTPAPQPRPMRTRLRERREAAASAAASEQQRQ